METRTLISIPFEGGGLPVYMACQAENKNRPGLIVIHEIWGLAEHIKDVANRLCEQDFEVVAPDLMAGTDAEPYARPELAAALFDPDSHRDKQADLRALYTPLRSPEFAAHTVAKLQAVFAYLRSGNPDRKIGVVGFCFGGTYSFKLAAVQPGLAAAVPFYGHGDFSDEQAAQIKTPILAFYGDQDKALMEDLPELEKQMKKAAVDFTSKVYPGAKHAFFNNTNPVTYNETAAKGAWQLTLSFLNKNLR